MILEEFIVKEIENLRQFQTVWVIGAAKKDWPTKLDYPEWQDQLRAWLETKWEKENKE
jgi:hypothetical protein